MPEVWGAGKYLTNENPPVPSETPQQATVMGGPEYKGQWTQYHSQEV